MNIVLYTKTGCLWCEGVIALLKEKNVEFTEKECRANKEHFDELVAKSGQTLTPTIDVDGEVLADSDADAIAALLKSKGHPSFQ